jgi:hypothetical protein
MHYYHVSAAMVAASLVTACHTGETATAVRFADSGIATARLAVTPAPRCLPNCFEIDVQSLKPGQDIVPLEQFGRISSIHLLDSNWLLVTDVFADSLLAIVDLSENRVVTRFGRRGSGPGEFMDPRWVTRNPADSTLWIYDYQLRRFAELTYAGSTWRHASRFTMAAPVAPTQPVWAPEGLVTNGYFSDHMLLSLNSTGKPTAWLDLTGPIPPVRHSASVRMRLNRTHMARHPVLPQIAIAYQSENRLNIVDLANRTVLNTKGPKDIVARFTLSQVPGLGPRFKWQSGYEQAYVAVTASDRRIYALFCGSCMERRELPRTVHVFDWSGSHRAEYIFPAGLTAVSVSPNGRLLVGASEDVAPRLYAWMIDEGTPD